jgi:hypothetical protein
MIEEFKRQAFGGWSEEFKRQLFGSKKKKKKGGKKVRR